MYEIEKTVLVFHSAEAMFNLVNDIKQYPSFLPWCQSAEIVSEEKSMLVATLGLSYLGIKQSFTTKNTNEVGRSIHFELVSGFLKQLDGYWLFTPLGNDGCKIQFKQTYSFNNRLLEKSIVPIFSKIADSLVDAFVKEADKRAQASTRQA
ncbi:MAG: type II toxin-antitoxin system RatA family toxin [Neisseriaceae bacterium]|nr:type II toxin-antitoxin system RatA family toxin [Neisseriaceae bacterium]